MNLYRLSHVKIVMMVVGALITCCPAFGQIRVEQDSPPAAPGSAQRNHPMYANAPAFFLAELDEEETQRHYVRMYLAELEKNRVTSQTIHWPEDDSNVPMAVAREFWDLYGQLLSELGRYVMESAAVSCSIDSSSPAAIRAWAGGRNIRDANILMFFDGFIEKVEAEISTALAGRLEWGVATLRNRQTYPVEKWVVDVEADDQALLQAYNRLCPSSSVGPLINSQN